ncbi:MAG: atsA 3 [Acidobacteria bacterium]|nr:atsA 3 [Acidobacteriota bacterium]
MEHAGTLSLIEGRWKYIEPSGGPRMNKYTNTELGNDPQPQLYDLAVDLGEKRNVAAEHPDLVRDMAVQLKRIRK